MAEKCISPGCEKPMFALGAGEPMCEGHWEDYAEKHSEYCPGCSQAAENAVYHLPPLCSVWQASESIKRRES